MKITELRLNAFRSCYEIVMNTNAGMVLVTGLNGSGKSTVREALKWCFTGRCQGLNGKGEGMEVLVPTFKPGAAVQVVAVLEALGGVSRTWKPQMGTVLEVHGLTGNATNQQIGLLTKLGSVSDAFLQACLDTDVFLRLNHKEAKALVLALLNVKVDFNEPAVNLVASFTLDELDATYQGHFKGRQSAKQTRNMHLVPPKPEGEHPPMEAIDARLKEVTLHLEELTRAAGASSGRRQVLEMKLERAHTLRFVDDPVNLDTQIEELEERLGMLEADTAPADLPKVGPERLRLLPGVITQLTEHKPVKGCVLDPDVPCDTGKIKFTNQAKKLQAELDASTANLGAALAAATSPLTAIRKQLDGLKERRAAITADIAFNDAQKAEQEALRAEIASITADPDAMSEIAVTRARLEKGKEIRANAATYYAALKKHEDAVAEHARLDAEVDRLEKLCDLMGPRGQARLDALKAKVGPFEDEINSFTTTFGWSVKLVFDPEWEVLVNDRPIETFSRSERYRVGIAIQLAIAKMSGLGFAVVDEMDMLLKDARNLVGRMLYQSELHQIFMLSSREPDVELPATLHDCIAYRLGLDQGQTVILEKAGDQ